MRRRRKPGGITPAVGIEDGGDVARTIRQKKGHDLPCQFQRCIQLKQLFQPLRIEDPAGRCRR